VELYIRFIDERVELPMEYYRRRLIFDMIALQQFADGREEPAVVSSGQVVTVSPFSDCSSLNEIVLRDRRYLVSALSLQARSVVIDDVANSARHRPDLASRMEECTGIAPA